MKPTDESADEEDSTTSDTVDEYESASEDGWTSSDSNKYELAGEGEVTSSGSDSEEEDHAGVACPPYRDGQFS